MYTSIMEIPIRDLAAYAAIFGFFAFAWFGWAQENPPTKLRPLLGALSILSAVIAGLGGYLLYTNYSADSSLQTDGDYMVFGVIVALELILSALGSLVLIKTNRSAYVASWISLVVAVHFIPLVFIFNDPWLYLLAGAIIVSVFGSIKPMVRMNLRPNTFICIATGAIVLLFAVRGLALFFLESAS